ncbi:MAG TPA: adenylate/guanylate cyclase domain-containing protein, partial [Vicinamibacteria bacterium]|nr:adenylate/guanylate cyclase domain-containing protein [Vicinamibacteria bacterium]
LEADRTTLFMHDAKTNELWALSGQGNKPSEIRFPSHMGIAGHVFTTGETINIPDAYADPRFNREVDRRTGYRTHNILCMPVINRRGAIIAVTQVLNKKGGPFTAIDERRLRAFSSQASIAMENARLFDEVNRVKNYNESVLESMTNGVITVSPGGVIAKVNSASLRLLRREKTADAVVGRSVREFFGGPNAWIADAVEEVERTGKPSVTMDADLVLSEHVAAPGEARRPDVVSMNLSMVPLPEAYEEGLGCILMVEDLTKEKRLKTTMARYMSKEVADKLLEEGEAALGGKMLKASILFTDIRSFTEISERIGAHEIVKLLNEYFGIMVDIIMEKGGILDKYIGDAIMAVFGAPFATPEDADHAVETAVGMVRALRRFNQERTSAGHPPLLMGVGVNTDEVVSGNIGSLKRMDFTVIGDGVNLASRLEGANKTYGTEILVSEMTVREVKGSYTLREVDKIRVKGKLRPVGVFEVLDHFEEGGPERDPRLLRRFDEGVALYRRGEWTKARSAFEEALGHHPADPVARLYRERCGYFLEHPPPSDWDGVWVMKDK